MGSNFGKRLQMLRIDERMTGSELGKLFGVTKSAVSSWEVRNRFPNETVLKGLAEHFGVSLSYLLGDSNIRKPLMK